MRCQAKKKSNYAQKKATGQRALRDGESIKEQIKCPEIVQPVKQLEQPSTRGSSNFSAENSRENTEDKAKKWVEETFANAFREWELIKEATGIWPIRVFKLLILYFIHHLICKRMDQLYVEEEEWEFTTLNYVFFDVMLDALQYGGLVKLGFVLLMKFAGFIRRRISGTDE